MIFLKYYELKGLQNSRYIGLISKLFTIEGVAQIMVNITLAKFEEFIKLLRNFINLFYFKDTFIHTGGEQKQIITYCIKYIILLFKKSIYFKIRGL